MVKKLFICLICFTCAITIINKRIVINASTDDSGTSAWSETSIEEENVLGVNHQDIMGTSTTGSSSSKEHVSILSMKTDGYSSKLVTWAVQDSSSSYIRATLTDIAKDYEANHPGWLVVGGINADQYYYQKGNDLGVSGSAYYNPQPYYPLIIDGERRFPINPYGSPNNMVGFLNDGSTNSLTDSGKVEGISIYILDENDEIISSHKVSGINQKASSNETTVWTPIKSIVDNSWVKQTVTSDSNMYIISDAETAHLSNSRTYINDVNGTIVNGVDVFFGKGIITTITKTVTLKGGDFAIETFDSELSSKLKENVKVIVQYDYENAQLNNVEAGSGYHSVQRLNGLDQTSNSAYNTKRYNRSLFGIKDDGTYVLITVDLFPTKYSGMNFKEINAMLKNYGVKTAYQDDGGGSVTAILRNKEGSFDVVNEPQYGNQRENLSGLLFVVRDPGITVEELTRMSCTLKQENFDEDYPITNVKAYINNQTLTFKDNKLNITGLEESTEYEVRYTYDVNYNGSSQTYENYFYFTTPSFVYPEVNFTISDITDSSLKVNMDVANTQDTIKDVYVIISDTEYHMATETLLIEGLINDTEYLVSYKYNVLDHETNKIYPVIKDAVNIKTALFKLPKILLFSLEEKEEERLKLRYEYEDKDSMVTNAYICYDGEKIDLSRKLGTETIRNLTFDLKDYHFKLIVEYSDGTDTFILESEEIVVEKTAPVIEPDPVDPIPVNPEPIEPEEPQKKGCKKKSLVSISFLITYLTIGIYILRKKKN